MKKLLFPLLALLMISAQARYNQVKIITGTVTDKKTGSGLAGVSVATIPGNKILAYTDKKGKYKIKIGEQIRSLVFTYLSYRPLIVKADSSAIVDLVFDSQHKGLKELSALILSDKKVVDAPVANVEQLVQGRVAGLKIKANSGAPGFRGSINMIRTPATESYAAINENTFKNALKHPLSTFSIDVDAASYSNVRRFTNGGTLPPADAVRIEEMVNYFDYDYKQPKGTDPINITTEISDAPWNTDHKLVKIGLQGKNISTDKLPASNLVFLIDVSGSMAQPNKLPLLVSSFKLLADQLRPKDKVAIVVYAGSAGLVLSSTSGDEKTKIREAFNQLQAGGSTAGGEGIELAYKIATDHLIKGGNNRVILATDGDFNVGASSDKDMERLIEQKRKSGIFLTVLGFGMGNIKDSKMETLADKGNGNYAYIDNISEARKVLISEFGGTLFTIAKDVKLQVEFNPSKVQGYRLIGYENRLLKAKDFNDDLKDAGELGAGHTVTALYEIIPVGVKSSFFGSIDDLKYQSNAKTVVLTGNSKELMTIKLRYKQPGGKISKLIETSIIDTHIPFSETSDNFRFCASVAELGMLLRQSDFRQNASFDHLIRTADAAKGLDKEGYRSEFVKLAKSARLLARELLTIEQTKKINEKN